MKKPRAPKGYRMIASGRTRKGDLLWSYITEAWAPAGCQIGEWGIARKLPARGGRRGR